MGDALDVDEAKALFQDMGISLDRKLQRSGKNGPTI